MPSEYLRPKNRHSWSTETHSRLIIRGIASSTSVYESIPRALTPGFFQLKQMKIFRKWREWGSFLIEPKFIMQSEIDKYFHEGIYTDVYYKLSRITKTICIKTYSCNKYLNVNIMARWRFNFKCKSSSNCVRCSWKLFSTQIINRPHRMNKPGS